jgi:pimeloyl-ACP methyl ester carboxylesterase
MLSDADVKLALELLPRPTHVRLHGIGHPLHSTNPRQVLEAITSFAAQL